MFDSGTIETVTTSMTLTVRGSVRLCPGEAFATRTKYGPSLHPSSLPMAKPIDHPDRE